MSGAGRVVGRERELAALLEAAARAKGGRGESLVIVGEAGLGKSVLCEAAQDRLEAEGWEWLPARCSSDGAADAYRPIAELLRSHFDLNPTDSAAALTRLGEALNGLGLPEAVPFLAGMLGLATRSEDLPPAGFRRRLHESVIAVLLASGRPTVLHVDDLHWADEPTLGLLADLGAAAAASPLLVLATARTGDAAPDAFARVELKPLPSAAVGELARRILGGTVGSDLAARIREHTGGNPLFVEELTRSLLEHGAVSAPDGEWTAAGTWDERLIPLTLEGIVAERVESLSERHRHALEVLAVIGWRPGLGLAHAVQPDIETCLPGLVASGLVDPVNPETRAVPFHHALTQQVVYSRLPPPRRAELHRTVGETAEWLLGKGEDSVDLLARHFYLGGVRDKAFGYLVRASRRAERLFANEQAITYLKEALEIADATPDPEQGRLDLKARWARVEEVRGGYEEALRLYREVLAEDGGRAEAVVGGASTLYKLGRYDEGLALVRERRGLGGLSGTEEAALAREEGRLLSAASNMEAALAVLQAGLAAVTGQDAALEAELLIHLGRTLELAGRTEEAYGALEKARLLLEPAGDMPRLATALRIAGGLLDDLGRPGAEATLERALALARHVGNAEETGACLLNLSRVAMAGGRPDEAIGLVKQSIEAFAGIGLKGGVTAGYANLAEYLLDLGRFEESKAQAETGRQIALELGHPSWISGNTLGLAQAELALGNAARAAVLAEEVMDIARQAGLPGRHRPALEVALEAYRRLGDADRVRELSRA